MEHYLTYEFWYDYIKPKYEYSRTLLYEYRFMIHVKTKDIYEDNENDIEKRFDRSNYEIFRPVPTGKIKKVIGLRKDKLDGKIMTKYVALRPKTYSYLINDGNSNKKAKWTRNTYVSMKQALRFNDYKNC